jgi:hypothetical protein
MEQRIPTNLLKGVNEPVLEYVKDKSAHSDIAEALLTAVKPLGDVQTFCPDLWQYRYLLVSTKAVIFGFAVGMETIAFRLPPPLNDRALATGGHRIVELGDEWIGFILFRNDWPNVDLAFWARKGYVYARETNPV